MIYTVWAECRNCVHYPEDHLETGCIGLVTIKWVGNTVVYRPYEKCICQKHIPIDNLKYLEWKYENSLSH